MSTLIANPYITAFLLLISWNVISCIPLTYDGLTLPVYAIPPMPIPMMMSPHHNHQFDPYTAMSVPAQYMMAPPMSMAPAQPRRSIGRGKPSDNEPKTDEQKALDGLPVSFVSISSMLQIYLQ